MTAVLSCVHANLQALQAVLADVAGRGVTRVVCLGDTLGYGPDPLPCLDLVMRLDVVLLGNHDHAVLYEPDSFCQSSERAIYAHQGDLERSRGSDRYLNFLTGLRPRHQADGVLSVHGLPRNPLNEYVFPEDVSNPQKMRAVGDNMGEVCFCGHTHVPGAFVENRPGDWAFHTPAECGDGWWFDGRKTLVNVGSVGQPRDGDRRAGYVLADPGGVRFVRVPYDVATTIRRVHDRPDLDDFHGTRLAKGH